MIYLHNDKSKKNIDCWMTKMSDCLLKTLPYDDDLRMPLPYKWRSLYYHDLQKKTMTTYFYDDQTTYNYNPLRHSRAFKRRYCVLIKYWTQILCVCMCECIYIGVLFICVCMYVCIKTHTYTIIRIYYNDCVVISTLHCNRYFGNDLYIFSDLLDSAFYLFIFSVMIFWHKGYWDPFQLINIFFCVMVLFIFNIITLLSHIYVNYLFM